MALTPADYSLIPTQRKTLSDANWIDFTSGAGNDFSQQFLPEIYEAEAERYGNRTVSGFLRMVGAELPMTSDQVVWSEQNRLHVAYKDSATANQEVDLTGAATLGGSTITLGTDLINVVRVGATVVVADAATGIITAKCYVNAVSGQTITVQPYGAANMAAAGFSDAPVNLFVYGSEFAKGTDTMAGSVYPSFTQFNNKPVIIKDHYEVSGSDTAQIGWVEVTDEGGTSGYLWYLKGEGETRLRFQDYLEMTVVEGELNSNANLTTTGIEGTQGLFSAVETRGNVFSDFAGSTGIADFDAILKRLDKEGAIEENMLFNNRELSLEFDNMLGIVNAAYSGGSSYGVFENSEEMALNLGFAGFRRGSYDFYKSDWKYLNDASTRGSIGDIEGILIPAGTTTVYDQMLGTNIRRPFLHTRYRASEADDRRIKTWLVGSVGGRPTNGFDNMEVNFLSERCLVTQAANNFVLFKATT
jgi:hypothetical protein